MTHLTRDPVINAISIGIRSGISHALKGGEYAAAVILVYSGIDSMAFLGMPDDQLDVNRSDFIDWVNRYISFPCKEQISGADLYGARCAMLHNYSIYSRMSRKGECRIIGYMDKAVPEVQYQPNINKDLVMVSVIALVEAFFKGVDKFLVDAFANEGKRQILEQRLSKLVQCISYEPEDAAG